MVPLAVVSSDTSTRTGTVITATTTLTKILFPMLGGGLFHKRGGRGGFRATGTTTSGFGSGGRSPLGGRSSTFFGGTLGFLVFLVLFLFLLVARRTGLGNIVLLFFFVVLDLMVAATPSPSLTLATPAATGTILLRLSFIVIQFLGRRFSFRMTRGRSGCGLHQ